MSIMNHRRPSLATKPIVAEVIATRQRMGIRQWTMIGALSILWGGSFFFVGIAVGQLPPLTIVFFRVGLASVILLAYIIPAG